MRRLAEYGEPVRSQIYCDGNLFDCEEYYNIPKQPIKVLIDVGGANRIELFSPQNGVWQYGLEGKGLYKGTERTFNWEDVARVAIEELVMNMARVAKRKKRAFSCIYDEAMFSRGYRHAGNMIDFVYGKKLDNGAFVSIVEDDVVGGAWYLAISENGNGWDYSEIGGKFETPMDADDYLKTVYYGPKKAKRNRKADIAEIDYSDIKHERKETPWKEQWFYDPDYEPPTDYENFIDSYYYGIDRDDLGYPADDLMSMAAGKKRAMRKKASLTVGDFINMGIDVDVDSWYADDLYIAFCGPLGITPEGRAEWADVLAMPIEVSNYGATVMVDDDESHIRAKKFFNSAAGYCPSNYWDKWFYFVD